MTAHDWFIEHRMEYAARLLDPEDEATFQAHLAHCDECRAEAERIERELAYLPMAVTPVTLRPGLRRRIVDHALGVSSGRAMRWAMLAAAVAGVLCGAAGWMAGSRHGAALAAASGEGQRMAALEDTLSITRGATRVLQASMMMDGQEAGVVIFADGKTHRWNVVMHGLPPAPPNQQYQLWFITADEGMVHGVDVPVDPARPAMFTTGMPKRGGQVMGAALILEPMDAPTDGPPLGKHLMHLML